MPPIGDGGMMFRKATIHDARLLYEWRLEAESERWWNGTPITYEDHLAWLKPRLDNPIVQLRIWVKDGEPLGMVRVDSNGEVAFHAETCETAAAMLEVAAAWASAYGGRLKASVDQADVATIELLEDAGFERFPVRFLALRP